MTSLLRSKFGRKVVRQQRLGLSRGRSGRAVRDLIIFIAWADRPPGRSVRVLQTFLYIFGNRRIMKIISGGKYCVFQYDSLQSFSLCLEVLFHVKILQMLT